MSDPQGPPGSTSPTTRAYAVLAMLFLFQTLNFFDKLVFGLSAVPMMTDLSLSPRQYGLIGSSFFLLFSVSGVLVGLFGIGRISTKWLLMALAAIWSATQLPIFFSHSVTVLVTCRILLGLGEGPGLPSALHARYDWFPSGKRGVPSAVILQGISVGLLAGGPILTWLIVREGWRTGFLVCGLLGLAWMVAWLVIGAEGPFSTENALATPLAPTPLAPTPLAPLPLAPLPLAPTPPPSRSVWLDRTVIGVVLMSTASYWIVGMAATWLPPLLQQGLGYAPMEVGWIISGVYAFQSPLLLLGSWIADTMLARGWTRRTALGQAAGTALVVSAAALGLAFVTTGALRLGCIAVAFAAPSLTTIYGPMTLWAVAPDQRGRLIVVIYSGNAVSALVSNAVTGWMVQSGTPAGPTSYAPAMLLTAAVLMLGAIAAFALIHPERTMAGLAKAARDHPPQEPANRSAGRRTSPGSALDAHRPRRAVARRSGDTSMKLASFRTDAGASWGIVEGDMIADLGSFFRDRFADLKAVLAADALSAVAEAKTKVSQIPVTAVTWLPVIPNPDKILCVGLNYEMHRQETGRAEVEHPTIFGRYANSQVGHLENIIRPRVSTELDFEGELAIVIGKAGRYITRADAWRHIAGYACYNDGSIRDFQRHTHQFTPGKNFPGTGGFGPWMMTPDELGDLPDLRLRTRVNGETVQEAALGQMIFDIPRQIEYCSSFTRLEPGDVIASGTPGGVGAKRKPPLWLKAGDLVEVEIDRLGTLRNRVADET